jgi:hypothetical protein
MKACYHISSQYLHLIQRHDIPRVHLQTFSTMNELIHVKMAGIARPLVSPFDSLLSSSKALSLHCVVSTHKLHFGELQKHCLTHPTNLQHKQTLSTDFITMKLSYFASAGATLALTLPFGSNAVSLRSAVISGSDEKENDGVTSVFFKVMFSCRDYLCCFSWSQLSSFLPVMSVLWLPTVVL